MKFTVHINHKGTPEPEDGTHYVVGRNGMFLRLRNDWIDAVVPMKEFQALEPVEVGARLRIPMIDARTFALAVAFFRKVFDLHGAEAVVLLCYGDDVGWMLAVPKQKVSYARATYDMTLRLPNTRVVGTMHSHANMSASHSGTDTNDEATFDGVHITVGNVDRHPVVSIDAEVVVRGTRYTLDPTLIDGVTAFAPKPADAPRTPEQVPSAWTPRNVSPFAKPQPLFTHDAGTALDDVPQEWLDQVEPMWGVRRPIWRPFMQEIKEGLIDLLGGSNAPETEKEAGAPANPPTANTSAADDQGGAAQEAPKP